MPQMPLEPVVQPRIELNHRAPQVFLVRDEEWTCQACEDHYALDVEGQERQCLVCMIRASGKLSIMLFGWTIQKSSSQVIAQPPLHRVDGK